MSEDTDVTNEHPDPEEELNGMLASQIELLGALKARVTGLEATIERMSASKLHSELRRMGIKYLVSTDCWSFLDVGTEKSLAALLYKLFDYGETIPLIVQHYIDEGDDARAEFALWAAEQAIFGLEAVASPKQTGRDSSLSLEPPIAQRALHPEDEAPATPLDCEDAGPQAPVDGPVRAPVDENNILSFDLQPAVPERDTEESRRGTDHAKEGGK